MESGGGLGKGAMRVVNRLAKFAADGVEKHVFVRRTQEALSVARVRGNGYMWNCKQCHMEVVSASRSSTPSPLMHERESMTSMVFASS